MAAEAASSDDEDHIPLSARVSRMPNNVGTCSHKCGDSDSLKKKPIKRPKEVTNSFPVSVKKSKVVSPDDGDEDDDDLPISFRRSVVAAATPPDDNNDNNNKPFSMMKKIVVKELALVEKSMEECRRKRQFENKRFQTLKRGIKKCSEGLRTKKELVGSVGREYKVHKKIQLRVEDCDKDLVAKEAQLCLMEDLIGEMMQEFRIIETELRRVRIEEIELRQFVEKVREKKEEELKDLYMKIAKCGVEMKTKEKELDDLKGLVIAQAKELESERMGLLMVMSLKNDQRMQMMHFESKKKQFEGQVKEIVAMEKQLKEEFEGQIKELKSEKMRLEILEKVLQSKVYQIEGRVKELLSEKEQLEGHVRKLELKKQNFEEQVNELESKQKELKGLIRKELENELKSEMSNLQSLKMELISKENQFEEQVKEVDSKEKQLQGRLKKFELKEEEFEGQVRELQSKEKQFERLERELESKERQVEGRVKEFQSREEEFEGRVNEIKSIMKYLEGQVKKLDGHLKNVELKEKPLLKSFQEEKESGNQPSHTIDERSLQTDEIDDIRVNLLKSPDPSKDVLDIILNPIIPPQCKEEGNAVIIDDSHIILLEQLMQISPPHIKPQVKEEAMKLALDLKASISENHENSKAVLGFLLLVSIYGLVPSFDEDEILKLFAFVRQHKIAVKLFGGLDFADKTSDYVENLIRKQQHIEAVRFICAYNLAEKYQPVSLLQEYVQQIARLSSVSGCRNTNSTEIKVRARDQEIAILESVLQCISDYNLQCDDLCDAIRCRIHELNRLKVK